MNDKEHQATQTRKNAQPLAQGVVSVARRLQALSLMPLHALAEGRNQSIPSLLHDMTGLSKARISQGNLDAIRPSTQAKVEQHLEEMLQNQFKVYPEGLQYLRNKIAEAPATRSGKLAPLADWVHQLEFLPWIPLPITKGVALTIDELLEALLTCCRNGDLRSFKSVLLAHFEHHGLAVRVVGQMTTEPTPENELSTLRGIDDWEQADNWTQNLVEHIYWDLISSLDAEWNSHYFSGRQTKPLFPLVMVRPQEGLMERMKVASRKNIILKPARRLLEFLYALAFNIRYKRWPINAPSPKTLAGVLYRPGAQELADESLISNYFDGTTKLTMDLVLEHWEQLLQHFMPKRRKSERPNPPFPMIILALQWQTLLVQNKGRTFLMPDMNKYETLWRLRRGQWETLQTQQDAGLLKTGQLSMKNIDWPAWSFSQSSSSC